MQGGGGGGSTIHCEGGEVKSDLLSRESKQRVTWNLGPFVFRLKKNWREPDLWTLYLDSGIMGCKVGYLPKHLAARADCYDGLCARIVEIYSSNRTHCASVAKRQKYHRGVATIERRCDMFVIA